MSHVAVGLDDSPTAAGSVALTTEISRKPLQSVNVVTNTITYTAKWFGGELSGQNIGEVGLFNAAANGEMFARVYIPGGTLIGPSDGYEVTWTFTVTFKEI